MWGFQVLIMAYSWVLFQQFATQTQLVVLNLSGLSERSLCDIDNAWTGDLK